MDALPGDKDLLPTSAAAKGVEYCNQLFLLERKYSGRNEKDEQIAEPMSSEERCNARQTQSKPVLEAFMHGLIQWNRREAQILRKRYSMQRTRRDTCAGFWNREISRSTTTVRRMRYDRCVSADETSCSPHW